MYIITIKNCLPKVVSYYIATQVSWRRLVWHVNNPDAPKQAPKPVVAQQTASQSVAAQAAAQSVAPTAPQPNIVKALSTPIQAPVPANGPVKVNTQIPIVLPTGPVKKVAAKTVMTFHNTSKQTTGTTSESDETEANRTRK